MEAIFKLVLKATTVQEVTEILKLVGSDKYKFEPVGSRLNNLATINISTDPAGGVTERITNAIDAVLEREYIEQGEPEDIHSPRLASQLWFDIKEGKLGGIENARDQRIQSLSDKIVVSLLNSNKSSKPTIEIRDKGIGLKPEQFKDTILSLNGSNKIGKRYLMGAFGQGGSTALSFNDYTIIISKPFVGSDRQKLQAAWTLVRINEGDYAKHKHEWYEYLINPQTGHPFVVDVDDETFESGTLVRHIMMDLGKYSGSMTAPTNGLWFLTHNYLFDPIIPFTISDKRKKTVADENRTVTGNNRLLTFTKNLEYFQKVPLTFRDGKVTIYYWVLNNTGENPKDRIKHYVMASKPIIITFNGQKQGVLGNGLIKKDLKLPFLDRYMIVQIEADNMDNESRRQLFSTTRESLRDTSILDDLQQLTLETLSEDPELKRLDRERKQKYFTHNDTQVLDSLRKRLARRINSFLRSSGSGKTVTATSTSDSANVDKLPEIPIETPPTFFEIITKSPKEVYSSQSFSIRFRTDAHPNYFARPETFAAFIDPQSFGNFTGTARVVGGYGLAYFKTNADIQIGDVGEITLELRPPMTKSFSSTIESLVVERPENSDTSSEGKNKTPNLQVEFLYKSDEYYVDSEWTEDSVAEVLDDQDGVIIYVSAENRNLNKLVVRAQRQNEAAVENIKNKYLEHISFYAFMIHKDQQTLDIEDSESAEKIIAKSMESASETVCGILLDFFEPIVTEAQEQVD